jgi:hypothetical protein
MQLLAPALDQAGVGKLAQHALERGAVGVLQAEGTRDLAGADLTGCLADEGEQVVFGGKRRLLMGAFHENKIRERNSLILGEYGCERLALPVMGWEIKLGKARSLAEARQFTLMSPSDFAHPTCRDH